MRDSVQCISSSKGTLNALTQRYTQLSTRVCSRSGELMVLAWSGIFTDLFIEQVLMAGIKSSGGLTRGRGFDESTRLLFLLSRPICCEVASQSSRLLDYVTCQETGILTWQRRQSDGTSQIYRSYSRCWLAGMYSIKHHKLLSVSLQD
jgi:hypothetical protein